MKRINIDEINFDLEYEGYIWYSNESKPELKNKINKDIFTEMPFVVEGGFYNKKEGISLNIKNIDGTYYIYQATLKDLPEDRITQQEFIAHKLEGIKKIKRIQFWELSDSDPLLEDMKTLIPTWQAFQGFIKN